jgi:hypothetical protein
MRECPNIDNSLSAVMACQSDAKFFLADSLICLAAADDAYRIWSQI